MTDRLVVDTDVVSCLLRKGDSRAKLYERHLHGRQLVISFMTVAELYRWTEERKWGEKKIVELETRLRKFVVCSVDPKLCKIWAAVMADTRRKGRLVQCADAWIAATALSYGIPLVTHNAKDFEHVSGLTIITEGTR